MPAPFCAHSQPLKSADSLRNAAVQILAILVLRTLYPVWGWRRKWGCGWNWSYSIAVWEAQMSKTRNQKSE